MLAGGGTSILSGMSSRDWDDSWYDDDEFPPLRSERGRGGIVAAAVVTFVMCAFNALCASCLLFCGFAFALVEQGNRNNGNFLPADLVQHTALLLLGIGITSAIAFVLQIMAGIGLINSRRWSRTLSFYLAGYSILISILLLFLVAKAVFNDMVGDDDRIGQTVLWSTGLFFHLGYAAVIFLTLLGRRAASSFR